MKKNTIIILIAFITFSMAGCSSALVDRPVKVNPLSPSPQVLPTNVVSPEPTVTQAPLSHTPAPTIVPVVSVAPVTTSPEVTDSEASMNIARKQLEQMSLEEKVGQLFFVRCRKETAEADIKTYHLGGYILFGTDFENQTRESIEDTIKKYQTSSSIPMLIGVDEEGGTVNRVSKFRAFRDTPFLSPQELYQAGGFEQITEDTIEKAKLLLGLGINVNLAPVCDISTNPSDFIYPRAFGQDAAATSEYVTTVVKAMNSQGIGCTLKHFPGYGNNVDTHTGVAVDTRSLNHFQTNDFLPFQAGINAGAGSVLVSHNIVTSMDQDFPASLSKKVHRLLREDFDFDGVIMTDDLSMDAITEYTNHQEAAVLAINAGNDMMIASDFEVQIPAVLQAVKDHTISEASIDAAVLRVLLWKQSLGLIPRD